jgi:3-hydroxyacyl-CoA dehydrogenase/enoyl-CoA hydratase/3-hydroxybutyryl-CoA epimerase
MDGNPTLRVEMQGDVMLIVMDRPDSRVNLIDARWLEEMNRAVDRAAREAPAALVLVSDKPGNFIAGADVGLIASLADEAEAAEKSRLGQELLSRIEDLPFPTVAAINGSCLGGGLETALAFRYRVIADDSAVVLGLPEVRLGILPGFGGTWRLPRAIGVSAALPMELTGKNLRPAKAWKLGLADRLAAPSMLRETAVAFARRPEPPGPRAARARLTDWFLGRTPPGRALLGSLSSKQIRKQTGGHYPAPPLILERVLDGLGQPRAEAMRRESAAFGRLAVTPVAKNLLFLFRGNEALARHPWTGSECPVDRASQRAAVIGAGTMGGGIAGSLAARGLDVRLRDVGTEALRIGMAGAAAPLNKRVKRRAMKPRERDAVLARISPSTGSGGMAAVDFVIEAVPEVLELKLRVFRELEGIVPETAFLATNTSSIPIERIAEGLERPERLIGIHFFNPVDRMPLVEVIPGAQTSPEVTARAVGIVRRLKKTPIVVGDRPGFLVNRLLLPYLNEAALAVEDGWSVDAIDRALLRFGMPMGPLRVIDEVGLDVAAKVSAVLEEAFGARARPAPVMQRLLDAGALGTKAGRGFWTGTGKERQANTRDLPAAGGSTPPEERIVERLLSGMINEAARCLAEGVAAEPDHLDLATVLGTGFPPFRGGLRRWAVSLGQVEVRRRLDRMQQQFGERFAPAEELGVLFRKD